MLSTVRITESDEQLRVDAPAPHGIVAILFCTVFGTLSGRLSAHLLWLILTDTGDRSLPYEFAVIPPLLLTVLALLGLYDQLATITVAFERHTIEFQRHLLGIRTRRTWFAVAEMRALTTTPDRRHGAARGYLYLKLSRGRLLAVLRHVQPAQIERLCELLQRRGWSYGDEPPDE